MSSPDPRAVHKPKLLAVASNGGHLVQLLRLAPAFSDYQLILVSTAPDAPPDIAPARYYCVQDSNFQQKGRLLYTALQTARIVFAERPRAVISTGAAPGLLALAWARLLGRRLIWIDSIANTEQLSLAGRVARRLTPHCFTQWAHLCDREGVDCIGTVIPGQAPASAPAGAPPVAQRRGSGAETGLEIETEAKAG